MPVTHFQSWLITTMSFSLLPGKRINPENNIKYTSDCLAINSATDCTENNVGSFGPNVSGPSLRQVNWWKDFPEENLLQNFPDLEVKRMWKNACQFSSHMYFHTIFKYHVAIREGFLNLKRALYIQPSKKWYFLPWRTV